MWETGVATEGHPYNCSQPTLHPGCGRPCVVRL